MFWKLYTKYGKPSSLRTTVRIEVDVDPQFVAVCLLDSVELVSRDGEATPQYDPYDETGWSPDDLREWAATRTERQIRRAITATVEDRGYSEATYLWVHESLGWTLEHLDAAADGVARATIDRETWESLFPNEPWR